MCVPGYLLGRNHLASSRLNYQHWLLRSQLGFLLSPHVAYETNTPLRIADVGSGTCLWMTEVAEMLPAAELHGFDISSAQQPPREWLPGSVNCHVHNAFEPFAARWQGYFDIVHIRLFLGFVKDANPSAVLQNVAGLVKPGGYLQWVEADPSSASVVTINPETARTATDALFAFASKPNPMADYSWVRELPDHFSRQGFEAVQISRYPTRTEHIHYWNMAWLMLYQELAMCILSDYKVDAEARDDAHRHLASLDDVASEFRNGTGIKANFVCVVGRLTGGS